VLVAGKGASAGRLAAPRNRDSSNSARAGPDTIDTGSATWRWSARRESSVSGISPPPSHGALRLFHAAPRTGSVRKPDVGGEHQTGGSRGVRGPRPYSAPRKRRTALGFSSTIGGRRPEAEISCRSLGMVADFGHLMIAGSPRSPVQMSMSGYFIQTRQGWVRRTIRCGRGAGRRSAMGTHRNSTKVHGTVPPRKVKPLFHRKVHGRVPPRKMKPCFIVRFMAGCHVAR